MIINNKDLLEKYRYLIKYDKKNIKYVLEEDIYSLHLDIKQKETLRKMFKVSGVDIRIKEITEKSRSRLVKDDNFGEVQTYNLEDIDKPKFNTKEEIEEFLEYNFIPTHIKMNVRRYGKNTTESSEEYPVIRLSDILKLKLSELEKKIAINYINDQGIRVTGTSTNYDSEFDNYDYIINFDNTLMKYVKLVYKRDITPIENLEKLREYKKTGDPKIREELILRNYKLVYCYVWRLAKRHNIDINDAKEYGFEGLIHAIDNYKLPEEGETNTLFSTYAIACIRGSVKSHLFKDQRGLFLNSQMYYDFRDAICQVEKERRTSFSKNPEMMDDIIDAFIESKNYPKYKKKELYKIFLRSFEELNEEELYVPSLLEEPNLEDSVFYKQLQDDIQKVMDKELNDREKRILEIRFGFNGNKKGTQKDVAKEFGISLTRVGQIERNIMRKIGRYSFFTINNYWKEINGEKKSTVKFY